MIPFGRHRKSEGHPDGLTLTDARKARERLRTQIEDGVDVSPKRETIDDLAEEFFAVFESLVATGERSERTLDVYRQRIARTSGPRSVASRCRS